MFGAGRLPHFVAHMIEGQSRCTLVEHSRGFAMGAQSQRFRMQRNKKPKEVFRFRVIEFDTSLRRPGVSVRAVIAVRRSCRSHALMKATVVDALSSIKRS